MSVLSTSSTPSTQVIASGYCCRGRGRLDLLLDDLSDFLKIALADADSASTDGLARLGEADNFFDVLEEIDQASRQGRTPKVDVIWDSINIWGRLPVTLLRTIDPAMTGSKSSWRFIQDLHPRVIVGVLRLTYWYKRVKPALRRRIRTMVSNGGLLDIKEALNSTDGVLSSLILSHPDDLVRLSRKPLRGNRYWFTDRVAVSVLSNVIFDKKFLPKWKKFKKRYRKAVLGGSTFPKIEQNWSWMSNLTPLHSRTKYGSVCLMNFAQTRNTGLDIHQDGRIQSLNKFKETVTNKDKTYSSLPSPYLEVALSKVDHATLNRSAHAPHESISTTAAYESGVGDGGKAKLAADILFFERIRRKTASEKHDAAFMWIAILITILSSGWLWPVAVALYIARHRWPVNKDGLTTFVDLETGEITDQLVPLDQYGELIFHHSLIKYIRGYPHMYKGNISVIREPGPKHRTVTASSFFHAECLQPWSHLTLELLKAFPESASGISKSRHGWEMAKAISPEDPDNHWMFGQKLWALSTDLEEATDYGHHDVARDIIRCFQRRFNLPKWYSSVVESLLCSPRDIFYEGKLLCRSSRAWFMGDPGTKTLLTALGISVVQKVRMEYNVHYFARVVGDDFCGISTTQEVHGVVLDTYRSFGMKISEDDTYISDRYVFFTEELIEIPRSVHDTIDRIKKSRRWGRSPYSDCVKGRLLLDIKKNRDDYSFTPTGRITQLGKDTSYLKEGGDPVGLFHLAMILQDVYLHTTDYEGFTYFPQEVCGEGKPIPFRNRRNFLRFILSRPREIKAYCRIMTECGWFAYNKSVDKPRSDTLRYSRAMFRHSPNEPWRVKVRELDLYHEIEMGEVPKYQAHSKSIFNRLSRFVISESEMAGKIAKGDFIRSLLGEGEYTFEGISKVIHFDNDVEINREELELFLDIWERDPNGFRPIRTERYFDREKAEAILGEQYPLAVKIRFSPDYTRFSFREKRDKMEDHDAVALWNWVKDSIQAGFALGEIPRRNISDDEIILSGVEEIFDYDLLFVVTNDIRLAVEIANKRLPKKTFRIPVLLWLESRCDYRLFGSPMTFNNVWVDMGSYESYMAQMNIHGVSALTTFSSLREMIVPDVKPDEVKVAPKPPPTRTDVETAVRFPIRGFPDRYIISDYDIFVGLKRKTRALRIGDA